MNTFVQACNLNVTIKNMDRNEKAFIYKSFVVVDTMNTDWAIPYK